MGKMNAMGMANIPVSSAKLKRQIKLPKKVKTELKI